MKNPTQVLKDHAKRGKKLIPPALNVMGERYKPYSWGRQIVPEIFWLAILIELFGLREAVHISVEFTTLCARIRGKEPKLTMFGKFSAFTSLTEEEKQALLETLPENLINRLGQLSILLTHILGEHPLKFLENGQAVDLSKFEECKKVLKEIRYRDTKTAVLSIATSIYLGMRQNCIGFANRELFETKMRHFSVIHQYPSTEESRIAASAFRASAPLLIMMNSETADVTNNHWTQEYWNKVMTIGQCFPLFEPVFENVEDDSELSIIIKNYRNMAKTELRSRINEWQINLNEVEKHQVIGGLLARQVTLALELSCSPTIWTPHSAPLFLRAMADVYITLAWIFKDPQARSLMYIEDGLGAIKLENAHRQTAMSSLSDPDQIEQVKSLHDYWDGWLNSQKMNDFVIVNLGSWSGMSARKMAEDSGNVDFYNHVYQPFSSAVHSNWAHISDKNTVACENPTHISHRVAAINEVPLDPYWLHLAAMYLQKTFTAFDDFAGLNINDQTSYDYLFDALFGPET